MTRARNSLGQASAVAIGLAFGFSAAMAQGVIERARPDYDAKGLPFGAFRLFPTLDLGLTSDNNVLRTNVGEIDDIFYTISPSAVLQSNWANHELVIRGGTDIYEFDSLSSENRTDWNAGADTRIDVMRGTVLNGSASYLSTHEARTSPNTPGFAAEPTPYSLTHIEGVFSHRPNRLGIRAGVLYDMYDFDSIALLPPGGILNNNDRDRNVVEIFGEASYEFSPGHALFLRGSYNDRDFDLPVDRTGVNRDSDGYRIQGGIQMLVSPLVQGEFYVGYLDQSYMAPLADVDGFDFGAALNWFVSPLVTIHINAARTINDTTLGGAAAADDIYVGGGFDFELLRNVIVQGDISYIDSTFIGSGRNDEIVGAGFGFRYLINSYLSANAAYRLEQRDSSVPGQDFDSNAFSLGARLQL